MKEVHLKKFSPEDIALWDVWQKRVDFSVYQTYLLPEEFGTDTNYCIYLIIMDNSPIGAIWLEKIELAKKSGCLGLFISEPDYWGRGYGTMSIQLLIEEAMVNFGVTQFWLSVRERNQRAIRCYEKAGFKKVRQIGPKQFSDGSIQFWYEMVREEV